MKGFMCGLLEICFNCRRNPQHKAQFSHPTDSDWGDGPRGVCPFGANCRRREPRHWAAHTHPPGTIAPAAAVPRPGQPTYVADVF